MAENEELDFDKCKKSLENVAMMLDCVEVCLQYINYKKDNWLNNSEAEKINNSKQKVKEILNRINTQLMAGI